MNTIKAKYTKSTEALAKDAQYTKRIKLAFVIVPALGVITWLIVNVIIGVPMHP